MSLEKLKGFAEWQSDPERGISYADDVIPAGIRAKLEEHKQRLFDDLHDRAKCVELVLRSIRYGTELNIVLGGVAKVQSRRMIIQLARHSGVMRIIITRSWLRLNNNRHYLSAEMKEMRKVAVFARELIVKAEALRDKTEGEVRTYVVDVIKALTMSAEWIDQQANLYYSRPIKPVGPEPTWQQLAPTLEQIEMIEGPRPSAITPEPAAPLSPNQQLTSRQVAKLLDVTHVYMRQMRTAGAGPAYTKVMSKRGPFETRIIYSLDDVVAWLRSKPDTLRQVVNRGAPIKKVLQEMDDATAVASSL